MPQQFLLATDSVSCLFGAQSAKYLNFLFLAAVAAQEPAQGPEMLVLIFRIEGEREDIRQGHHKGFRSAQPVQSSTNPFSSLYKSLQG